MQSFTAVKLHDEPCKPFKGVINMALKRMSIKVSEDMHAWLQVEAEKRGLTMNAIIIFALETYYTQTTVMPNLAKLQEMAQNSAEK